MMDLSGKHTRCNSLVCHEVNHDEGTCCTIFMVWIKRDGAVCAHFNTRNIVKRNEIWGMLVQSLHIEFPRKSIDIGMNILGAVLDPVASAWIKRGLGHPYKCGFHFCACSMLWISCTSKSPRDISSSSFRRMVTERGA